MKLLLVEDNELIVKGLKYFFEEENISLETASSYLDGLDKKFNEYDLILLDISLPDGNGFKLCETIKSEYSVPVIFITALTDEDSVVRGLEMADDYITKPFRNRELLARINKLVRINKKETIYEFGKISININSNVVSNDGNVIELSALEHKLLNLLILNINNVVSTDTILDFIYDETGNYVNDNTVRVYIKRIRNKIGSEDIIKTVKGLGYRIDEGV